MAVFSWRKFYWPLLHVSSVYLRIMNPLHFASTHSNIMANANIYKNHMWEFVGLAFGSHVVLPRRISSWQESCMRSKWASSQPSWMLIIWPSFLHVKLIMSDWGPRPFPIWLPFPFTTCMGFCLSAMVILLVRDSTVSLFWHSRLYSRVMLVSLWVSRCSSGILCKYIRAQISMYYVLLYFHIL